MAIAFDAASESHTGTTGATGEIPWGWTHTPSGTPRGVLVFLFDSYAEYVYGVTYGGVSLALVDQAVCLTGEAGSCYAWFLGSGIPSGPQDLVVDTDLSFLGYGVCITVTSDNLDTEATETVKFESIGTLAEQNVDDGSPGSNSLRFAGINSGLPAVPAAGSNSTAVHSIDFGSRVDAVVREKTAGQGSRPVGFYSTTSDDRIAVHVGIREIIPVEIEVGTGESDETDAALAEALQRNTETGLGDETDAGLSQSWERILPASVSAETDEAVELSIGSAAAVSVGVAEESDESLAPTWKDQIPARVACETDASSALVLTSTAGTSGVVSYFVLPARAAPKPQAKPIWVAIRTANEQDESIACEWIRVVSVRSAESVESAGERAEFRKAIALQAAVDRSSPVERRLVRQVPLSSGSEFAENPTPARVVRILALEPARQRAKALPRKVWKRLSLTTSETVERAGNASIRKRVELSAAVESDRSQVERIAKRARIGLAQERGWARPRTVVRRIEMKAAEVDWIGIEDEEILEVLLLAS